MSPEDIAYAQFDLGLFVGLVVGLSCRAWLTWRQVPKYLAEPARTWLDRRTRTRL